MKFMTIVKSAEKYGPPPKQLLDAIYALAEEGKRKGVFLGTGGLGPTASGARVRLDGGELRVTDGPFSEAKEVVGGYAIFDLKDKAEAVEWARRFMDLHRKHWPVFEGECEVRPLFDGMPDEPTKG
jgi:hypothetical protein